MAILDLNLDLAREVSSKLGSNSIAVACDVSKIESINQAVSHVIENFRKIDILVNSAGIAALNPAEKVTQSEWDKTLSINLTGTFLCHSELV